VAALALLFHAFMHTTDQEQVEKKAMETASLILIQPSFYIFLYERSLLSKLFHDHHTNSPEKQVPITKEYPETNHSTQ
jgi:hypothetical protein